MLIHNKRPFFQRSLTSSITTEPILAVSPPESLNLINAQARQTDRLGMFGMEMLCNRTAYVIYDRPSPTGYNPQWSNGSKIRYVDDVKDDESRLAKDSITCIRTIKAIVHLKKFGQLTDPQISFLCVGNADLQDRNKFVIL